MKISYCVFALFMCLYNASYAEEPNEDQAVIFKWKDEQGKVHFGSSVPPQYKDSAEALENKPMNILAPEPEVQRQNSRAVQKLRIEDSKRREKAAKSNGSANSPAYEPTLTKEYCRDNFVTVKRKTECFRRVAEQSNAPE